ncbi:MAG: MAPEG family protein [Xanthobacteraceae bacterium]|uniref:MAPEG family protein n=1 Tax=Pseudolabrys sp. TaxID=1960880 RepID=UPI003D0A410A
MSVQAVLLPVFAMVLLTFVLLIKTAVARRADIAGRRVQIRDIALGQLAWTPQTQQYGNSYNNQFQLPVLFYVVMTLALITKQADLLFVVLAWVFVALRVVHAFIHVTNNRVMRRGLVFGLGWLVLMAMWIVFAVRILLAI